MKLHFPDRSKRVAAINRARPAKMIRPMLIAQIRQMAATKTVLEISLLTGVHKRVVWGILKNDRYKV